MRLPFLRVLPRLISLGRVSHIVPLPPEAFALLTEPPVDRVRAVLSPFRPGIGDWHGPPQCRMSEPALLVLDLRFGRETTFHR